MTKANKAAAAVLEMLSKGMSTKEITNKVAVSASYVHSIKKQLAEGVGEAVETVRQTAVEHTNKVKEMIEDWRAEADTDVDAILTERGRRYGKFSEHARIAQNIKRAMEDSPNWYNLPDDTKETLEMTAHKIGRLLNGDPEYADNVIDIIGYMQLVLDRINGKVERGISS
jgi:predicted methyltransferase